MRRRASVTQQLLAGALVLLAGASVYAQGRGGPPPGPPRTPKAAAPIDLTGYWVSVVTEDWRWRMFTPPKGDYAPIQLNAEARKIADTWDPAKDEAAGEQCKGYGAGGIMRLPGRLHITWEDEQTLKVEADTGTQTRFFFFAAPKTQGADWQGVSQASWDQIPGGGFAGPQLTGSLKVVTAKLKPGYLRKNGVPYGANAVLTEYFDRVSEPNGASYIVLTSTLEDPAYLAAPYLTAIHFRKQPDASGWNPTPCSAK